MENTSHKNYEQTNQSQGFTWLRTQISINQFLTSVTYFLETSWQRLMKILSLSILLIEVVIVQKPSRSKENFHTEDAVDKTKLFMKEYIIKVINPS